MKRIKPLSKLPDLSLKLLGEMIKAARTAQKMTQTDLGERLNVSRQTVSQLENGDKYVAIGTVFEACYILGIPLLNEDEHKLTGWLSALNGFNSIINMPKSHKKVDIDDDF